MERPITVLVVDDEADIVSLLRDFLESEGYTVLTASDGLSALKIVQSTQLDCVLLDVMMPGMTGFDLLRKVRETSEVPVLFLSARHEDHDKIRGLGLGADDYIVKSATPAEVIARVKAVLRRTRRGDAPAPVQLQFGRLVLDLRARETLIDGQPVAMTAREFDLLQHFAEHPRQVFSRDQLFERFWGEFGDRHTVTVHVGRLREKIEIDPSEPEFIVTVWGVGYRFEGERRS
ncbi:response regulator transcription factor [soil metagenome]